MAYLGKEFVLDSQENFKEFIDAVAIELSDEAKRVVVNHKGTLKLEKLDDEQYKITTSEPGGSIKEVTFKSGVPFDDDLSGTPAKTTITLDGDEMTTVTNLEDDKILAITRTFSEDQVVVSIKATGFEGTVKRVYKPVA